MRTSSLFVFTVATLLLAPGCTSDPDDAATSNASITDDATDDDMVEVVCQGVRWKVARNYVGPVGIGEAERLADEAGTELPSPELVDAIWRAADLKLTPLTESPNLGNDPTQLEHHKDRLAQQLNGKTFNLVAGNFKDVVRRSSDGKIGLYGWQRGYSSSDGVDMSDPSINGRPIQPFFGGHSPDWKDYSQGFRLVKRIGPVQ